MGLLEFSNKELTEFSEKGSSSSRSSYPNAPGELKFTGNWFIDAGIIGFINLMEDVYGWDINKLREILHKNPTIVYYGYFPLAYLFYHSKVKEIRKKINEIKKEISNLEKKKKEKIESLKNIKNPNSRTKGRISELRTEVLKIERQICEKNKEIEEKLVRGHSTYLQRRMRRNTRGGILINTA